MIDQHQLTVYNGSERQIVIELYQVRLYGKEVLHSQFSISCGFRFFSVLVSPILILIFLVGFG
jgi:hypothetical protein